MKNLKLDEAIKERNPIKVKTILCNNFLIDHTDKEGNTKNDFEYAKEKWPEIIEKHDNKAFLLDKEKWDKNYFTLLRVQLMDNFSEKRYWYTYDVVKYIYKDEIVNTDKLSYKKIETPKETLSQKIHKWRYFNR